MNIVFLGLSITSSWGNGHATTYRSLIKGLAAQGHGVLFLERDVEWYAANRDLPSPPYCRVHLYRDCGELRRTHHGEIAEADLVVVGSYVPDGIAVADYILRTARGCTAFYDIDTPITLAALDGGGAEYLEVPQVGAFDLYLSFTGGPTLERLERRFGARRARPLYCAVDPDVYFHQPGQPRDRDLGYLGTYSEDRQPTVDQLLIQPARMWPQGRFVIAGPQYPPSLDTPANVERIVHLPPDEHRGFYNRLRFTLNVTRRNMIEAGYSPSVRLFEAGACGTAIISDDWPGLETVLTPSREILIARTTGEVLAYLNELPDAEREALGARARERILASHTSDHRANELAAYVSEVASGLTARSA